jgi:hypothetical protein
VALHISDHHHLVIGNGAGDLERFLFTRGILQGPQHAAGIPRV